MVSKRDRIVALVNYLNSLGIIVNIGKNKARGNKGFFKVENSSYRIDLAKTLNNDEILNVLVHEFAHYLHYVNDRSLKSLAFIFGEVSNEIVEELLTLTVKMIPKKEAETLFGLKETLLADINNLEKSLLDIFKGIKLPEIYSILEKSICLNPIKFLLKYDRVKVLEGFSYKIYSVENLEKDFPNLDSNLKNYLRIKSKQRALRRVNSKINRLNKYYNSESELFARSFECFILNPTYMEEKAPVVYEKYLDVVNSKRFSVLNEFIRILNT